MLNSTAEKIFKLKYAKEGETWQEACLRVASYISSIEEDNKYLNIFFNMIYNLVFIPGGRILANSGTNTKNLLNCFVLPINDSREYIYNLKKVGLSPDGHKYFKVLEKTLQDDQLTHFNISVSITDGFMKAALEGEDWNLISKYDGSIIKTLPAMELLYKIAERSWESGDPGVFFYDRTNEDNLVPYLGSIEATNPCISGDTKILTVYEGAKPIEELIGREVLVHSWNPETKLPVVRMMRNIRMTRDNIPRIRLTFDSGLKVICTYDHSFYTFRGEKV